MSTSLLADMGLSFPSTPTDFDVGTDFTSSLAGVTNPIYRSTPISFGGQSLSGDPVVVRGLQDYISSGNFAPEDLAILIGGLVTIGALASTMGGGSPKVEVTAKGPNPPATPADPATPAPVIPAPVIPAPVTPSVDPADPAKEVPKQNPEDTATPAEKEIAKILGIPLADVLKYGLPLLSSFLGYKSAQDAREEAKGVSFGARGPVTATRRAYEGSTYKPAAQGGIMSLAGGGSVQPMYLGGITDGMADEVPAHIDGKRPAALSDGEFVIPADVVSHLGNGNSNAGAQRLYKMMDDIRAARTGNPEQGIQINPNKFLPR